MVVVVALVVVVVVVVLLLIAVQYIFFPYALPLASAGSADWNSGVNTPARAVVVAKRPEYIGFWSQLLQDCLTATASNTSSIHIDHH